MKRVLSLVLFFVLCLSLFSCGSADDDLDFISENIKPYIDFKYADLVDGSYELIDEYGIYDAARAQKQFRNDRLYLAAPVGLKNEGKPSFGDAAHLYYEIAMTENGEGSFSNLYTNEGTQTVFIGYWEILDSLPKDEYPPVFYNKTISDYLSEMTVIPHITEGSVKAGDKVRISYSRYRLQTDEQGNIKTDENGNKIRIKVGEANNLRIDTACLSLYEEAGFASFLLNSLVGKPLGTQYSVQGTETVENEDGTETTVAFEYDVTPVYTVEETFQTVRVAIPKDTYSAEDGESLVALNGKTVYFRLMLESYYQYNTPAMSDQFLYDAYGFVTGKKDSDELLEAATEKYIQLMKKTREDALRAQALSVVMSTLRDEGGVRKYPKVQYNTYYDEIFEMLSERYREAKEYAETNGDTFTMTVEEYAIYYLTYYGYYDTSVYSSLKEYIEDQVEGMLDARIMLFGAAQLARLRLSKEEYRALYEEELQTRLENANASGDDTVTHEDLIKADGGEENGILVFALSHAEKAITDFIYENNTWSIKEGSNS